MAITWSNACHILVSNTAGKCKNTVDGVVRAIKALSPMIEMVFVVPNANRPIIEHTKSTLLEFLQVQGDPPAAGNRRNNAK